MQTVRARTLCDFCLHFPVATALPETPALFKAISGYSILGRDYVEAKYECQHCHTIWLHRKNKRDSCEGFRLHP